MDMYREAVFLKLRIQTPAGLWSVEQVATLDKKALNAIAVDLDEQLAKSARASYLDDETVENKVLKLKRDIVVDILMTKKAREQAQLDAAQAKEHNAPILDILEEKRRQKLLEMTEEDLLKQLK